MVGFERKSDKLKVFISYSRTNLEFVNRVQAALKTRGIEATVDRTDIEKSEDWWQRVQQLIRAADTIVFVLSPSSVRSEICQREVHYAESLKKRFVPIVGEELAGLQVPDALARLNYIFFVPHAASDATGDFDLALDQLVAALEVDIVWIREHTRLGELALRWMAQDEGGDLLLRGAELKAAELWITKRPSKAPDPSDAHRSFVSASRTAATKRQRWWVGGAMAVAVGALALAGIAYVQSLVANEQRGEAQRQATTANEQRDIAETRRRETVELRQQTQKTESGLLAKAASELVDDTIARDTGTAVLLTLEALPDHAAGIERPYVPQAELQLDRALRTGHERAVLAGHTDDVVDAVWSPDGTRIASASADKTARLWDSTTGRELVKLEGHSDGVNTVAWSPDNARLITASDDGTARIWEAATGKEIVRLTGHGDSVVYDAAWNKDGTRIVTASADQTARVWDAVTGKEIVKLVGHGGSVGQAIWSPDGARILTTSNDETGRVWSAASGKQIAMGPGGKGAWSPDGTRIVTATSDGTAIIWSAGTGRETGRLKGHTGPVASAIWSPDGTRIVTASDDKTARVWDAATGKEVIRLDGHADAVVSATWSLDGKRIVTASDDKTARIWEATTGKEVVRLEGHNGAVVKVAWSPDATRVVSASRDGTVRVWLAAGSEPATPDGNAKLVAITTGDPRSRSGIFVAAFENTSRAVVHGRGVVHLRGHTDDVINATWSADGKRIVTASSDNTARVWDAATGKELTRLVGHKQSLYRATWSPDGTRIATASFDNTARVWDATSGKEIVRLVGHNNWVRTAAWSPDGRRIVTTSADKTARIWDAASGREIARCDGLTDDVGMAAWSADGTRIVTGSGEKGRVWDAASGKEIARLEGHTSSINSAAWSSDGTRIVTASGDKTIRLWDAETGRELLRLEGHGDSVNTVAWSHDGAHLLTTSFDHTARVWEVATGQEIARLQTSDGIVGAAWIPGDAAVDGSTSIVTASTSETTNVWQVFDSTQALVDAAKQQMPRCLTQAQRRQYFLPDAPPLWCVAGRRWPYNTDAWQAWLLRHNAWVSAGRKDTEPSLPQAE